DPYRPAGVWSKIIEEAAAGTFRVPTCPIGYEAPPMFPTFHRLLIGVPLAMLIAWGEVRAAEPKNPMRGVLVGLERVTPEFLAAWKARGATAMVVPLDEAAKRRWETMARTVERAGMTLWPWIEVARNPAMADAHPEWMAAIGAHHDDWRRRF